MGSGVRLQHRLASCRHHIFPVGAWASGITSSKLSFFISLKKEIKCLVQRVIAKIERDNAYKGLGRCLIITINIYWNLLGTSHNTECFACIFLFTPIVISEEAAETQKVICSSHRVGGRVRIWTSLSCFLVFIRNSLY